VNIYNSYDLQRLKDELEDTKGAIRIRISKKKETNNKNKHTP
jgi:hypothetical protein